jgi:hypothetical protein
VKLLRVACNCGQTGRFLRAGDGACRWCGERPPRPPRTDPPSTLVRAARVAPAAKRPRLINPGALAAALRCPEDAAAPERERLREAGQRLQAARFEKLRAPRARPPPSLWELEELKVAGQLVEGPRRSPAEAAQHYDLQCRAAGTGHL